MFLSHDKQSSKRKPDAKFLMGLAEEEKLWRHGSVLIGVDEAGRGPLAGPVVAAAVALLPKSKIKNQNAKLRSPAERDDLDDLLALGVNDSKKLSPKKREEIYAALTAHHSALWAVGIVGEKAIDRINILQASLLAMRQAVEKLLNQANIWIPDVHIFIDGREVIPRLTANQKSVIGGDGKIFSIAAASIIAKVTRDRLMDGYAKKYPRYQFEKHKGYGTKLHYEMIRAHGLSPIHRKSFRLVI